MRIWIDDIRPAPFGYAWARSVNEAKAMITRFESDIENALDEWDFPPVEMWNTTVEIIDIDHDAGDFAHDGGDYIRLLDWLEATGRNYPIRLHTMNPVGRMNMEAIIRRNNWKEVK